MSGLFFPARKNGDRNVLVIFRRLRDCSIEYIYYIVSSSCGHVVRNFESEAKTRYNF